MDALGSTDMVTYLCISGYQLCDNSVGVLFNDYTRLIMYADGDSLQYIDKAAVESYLNVRSYPPTLNKKVRNMRLLFVSNFYLSKGSNALVVTHR